MNSGVSFGLGSTSSIRTGEPLGHLDVVARRVLRRQERLREPRAGAEAGDSPLEDLLGIGVDVEVDRHADLDVVELGLLEVGVDPDVIGTDRDQGLARLDPVAGVGRAVLDVPGDLRLDLGPAQAEPVVVDVALGLGHGRLRDLDRRGLLDDPAERLFQALARIHVDDLLERLAGLDVVSVERDADLGQARRDARDGVLDARLLLGQVLGDVERVVVVRRQARAPRGSRRSRSRLP